MSPRLLVVDGSEAARQGLFAESAAEMAEVEASMTPRMNGAKPSYPFPVWNGLLKHRAKMKQAIWTFLWCIDAITKEENGVGFVLGGAPVKVSRIAADLSGPRQRIHPNLVYRELRTLRRDGYITVKRTSYGLVITVRNSRKFRPRSRVADAPKEIDRKRSRRLTVLGQNKEDIAVDREKTKETKSPSPTFSQDQVIVDVADNGAAARSSPSFDGIEKEAFAVLGFDKPAGNWKFREAWVRCFAEWKASGKPYITETMEQFIQGCEGRIGVPRFFYESKKEIEQQETAQWKRANQRPPL